jgi:predicted ester cyclase
MSRVRSRLRSATDVPDDLPGAPSQTMSGRYKNLVLALNHAFNSGDLRGVDDLLTPDFAERDEAPGPAGYKAAVRRLRAALDEPWSEVLGLVGEGSSVVLRARLTGVHVGEIVGVAPTRCQIDVEQIHFYEGRDGMLTAHHYIRDDLALLGQLGFQDDSRPL